MTKKVYESTLNYIERMPKHLRKQYGQFFTGIETARFMAGLFTIPQKEKLSILDPGAGTGILSAALIERLQGQIDLREIELTCYENDPNIYELLRANLEWVQTQSRIPVTIRILTENYILSQQVEYNYQLGATGCPWQVDMVICNPPYLKVAKEAPEARVMQDVCHGAPNLYFLFAMMSLFNLKPEGELVYILPRSWTSGAYFKKFRQKFLEEGTLEHLHLFIRRDKVFKEECVLQETMILKVKKSRKKPERVMISTSQSAVDFSKSSRLEVSYDTVVCGGEKYVYLVTNQNEMDALFQVNQWPCTLPSLGLRMKTGLTVDFRNQAALRDTTEEGAIPLFYSQHIQGGNVVFPIGRKSEYLVSRQRGLRQKNTNYLFVKRFTSKEEARRLQCGVYLARKYPQYTEISTQNKINFISGLQELSECVLYGLYVLFNSSLYDTYYRILNGSTQVNATEVNAMPVPPLKTIEAMGKALLQYKTFSEASCDDILRRFA